MTNNTTVENYLAALGPLAPAGYAIILHMRFVSPTFLLQSYSADWREIYLQKGYAMVDPVVRWSYANRGTITWDHLEDDDPSGVLKDAKNHGLIYGLVCAVGPENGHSFGGFSRSDRPFTASETSEVADLTQKLHDATTNLTELSPETAAALKEMSISYTQPA